MASCFYLDITKIEIDSASGTLWNALWKFCAVNKSLFREYHDDPFFTNFGRVQPVELADCLTWTGALSKVFTFVRIWFVSIRACFGE